jgi:hypothetical protein
MQTKINSMYRRIPVMKHKTDSLYALGHSSDEEGYAVEDLTQMEGEPDEFVEDSQEQNQVVDSMSPSVIHKSDNEELDRTCIDSSDWRLLRG